MDIGIMQFVFPDVDIRFFQATATAIPTLFIAMAFTAKAFHPDTDVFKMESHRDARAVVITTTICAIGEMVSLAVLAADKPGLQYAYGVGLVVAFQLLVLCITAVSGPLSAHKKSQRLRDRIDLITALILMFALPGLAFIMIMT